jgi:hypothetical protein
MASVTRDLALDDDPGELRLEPSSDLGCQIGNGNDWFYGGSLHAGVSYLEAIEDT